ncbi:L-aspartate oxidase [Nitrosophilus alvini]|uniref:L-aspartate oxidase n=1 Tax=Nitrosophilus alvini TaxID=2714855 RepID=UPI00190A8991|nr:L-aspartate oxidase [Nitrosophilus alvini]
MIYDYIIVGAGIAGLYAALNIPENKKVAVLSKEPLWECNTFYAQGGVATARDEKDINDHIEDTLKAGCGLCNKEAVEIMSQNSILVINDLINRGFEFDTDEEGNLLFTREAAHSRNRILHAGGDATGRLLHKFLIENCSHKVFESVEVADLLVEEGVCYGVTVKKEGKLKNIYGKNVFIASGGVGSLYEYHTNANTISADLQGICLEKGIELADMEFLQFHPTVFILSHRARKLLLTEALRGEGATVVDEKGRRFLFDYDSKGELASRDIVSRAIYDYKLKGHKVYLSFENFEEEFFRYRFPTIYKNFKELGFNVPRQKVPVSPAFHFAMGGIKTDLYGKVPGFENLYAIGEVACTGVHGANRLASNSLLEGLVFSRRAVEVALINNFEPKSKKFPVLREKLIKENDKDIKNELRRVMWEKVGIIRKREKLQSAFDFICESEKKDIGRFLKLRLLCAKEIVKSALARKESIGAHYIED